MISLTDQWRRLREVDPRQIRDALVERGKKFNAVIDAEQIEPFQKYVYYPIVITFTVYLAFFADGPPQAVEETLGTLAYDCWLMLGAVFPALSLLGRRLYNNAARTAPGEPNSAYGGAWLMLAGDFGVWQAIAIFMACVLNAAWWGQAFWGLGFVVMGIPGGGIFTYRSARRLRQIRRRVS